MIVLKIILIILLVLLLAVLGIFLIALILPVSVSGSYIDGKTEYKVKYAFLTVISSDEKGILNYISKRKNGKKSARIGKSSKKKNIKSEKKNTDTLTENQQDKLSENITEEKNQDSKPKTDNEKKSDSDTNSANVKSKKIKSESKSGRIAKLPEMWETITQIYETASKPFRRILKGVHLDKIYIDFKISDMDAYDCALKYGKMCILVYNSLAVCDRIFTLTKKSVDVKCVFNEEKSVYNMGMTVRLHPITAVISALGFLWQYYFKIHRPKKKNISKTAKAVREVK